MEVNLKFDKNMRFVGTNELGHKTFFDTHPQSGGDDSAPTPMEVLLESMAACSCMDIVPILKKKKKHVEDLRVIIKGERSEIHPKVFNDIHFIFELVSPDTELSDFEHAVELSMTKYCSVTLMIKRSGCNVTYECKTVKS